MMPLTFITYILTILSTGNSVLGTMEVVNTAYFTICSSDTFLVSSNFQMQEVNSYFQCAAACSNSDSCIGFNVCWTNTSFVYECYIIYNQTIDGINCDSDRIGLKGNCTFSKLGQDNITKSEEENNSVQCLSPSQSTKVFHTTKDGTILYGNKSDLIKRIRQGEGIKVLLTGYDDRDYLFNTNQITVNDKEACAQSVFTFDQRFYHTRQLMMFCTSGFIQNQLWVIGQDFKERDITIFSSSVWFTDGRTRIMQAGESELSSSLLKGLDLMVLFENNRLPLYSLNIHNFYTVGQFAWGVPRIDSMANIYTSNFDGNCAWISRVLSSSGTISSTKWQSGNGSSLSNEMSIVDNITWLADDCWKLVYEHAEDGQLVFGSLMDLQNYIDVGHRVRVVFDGKSVEVDFLFKQNENIIGQLSMDLDRASGLVRVVTMLSTDGQIEKYTFGVSRDTIDDMSASTISAKWYVGMENWTEIYKVAGSYDLSDALYNGKSLRILHVHPTFNMSFTADGIFRSNSIGCICAIVSRYFEVTTGHSGRLELSTPVGNVMKTYRDDGEYIYKTFNYGQGVVRESGQIGGERLRWFISD